MKMENNLARATSSARHGAGHARRSILENPTVEIESK
jgi:hypothetical protein